MNELTADRLRHLLDYEPSTGILRWKVNRRGGARVGNVAGTVSRYGYIQLRVDGRFYLAHRLAWLHVHGSWPDGQIDHVDRNRTNNRIANLREATASEQMQNRVRKAAGYERRGSRYVARIQHENQQIRLGSFATADEAHAAYLDARARLHPFAAI